MYFYFPYYLEKEKKKKTFDAEEAEKTQRGRPWLHHGLNEHTLKEWKERKKQQKQQHEKMIYE